MRGEAAQPKEPGTDLDRKTFFKPELSISTSHAPLGGVLPRLPNRAAWESLLAARGDDPHRPQLKAWLDPRSGAATNVMGPFPLIPGRGVGNRITLRDLAGTLGRPASDVAVREPALEIVPIAPPELQDGEAFAGPMGSGYGHRLVWTFVFQRVPDESRWEVMVDAHSGEVIAFQDLNRYESQQVN